MMIVSFVLGFSGEHNADIGHYGQTLISHPDSKSSSKKG